MRLLATAVPGNNVVMTGPVTGRLKPLFAIFALLTPVCYGQVLIHGIPPRPVSTAPSGSCAPNAMDVVISTGALWTCAEGTWTSAAAAGAGGSGGISITAPPYNAVCDGLTDDSAAIQAAYTALQGANQGEIDWPSNKICAIGMTIYLRNVNTARILGGQVRWVGGVAGTAFEYDNDRNVTTQGMYITPADSTHTLGSAVVIEQQNTGGFGISSGNIWIGNVIEGVTSGRLAIGFEFAQGSAGNVNNDLNKFYGNEVRNYSTAGWQIDHTQSTDHEFYGNQCYGNGTGQECLTNFAGGSIKWFGGFTGGNLDADFVLGVNASHPQTIEAVGSEGSNRFVKFGSGPFAAQAPLSLINDRFSTNALNADGHCVTYNGPGPLNVIGGSYGQGNAVCDIFWNPDTATFHAIYGQITGVSFSGLNSNARVPLAKGTGVATVNVLVAYNVYSDGNGNAVDLTHSVAGSFPAGAPHLTASSLKVPNSPRLAPTISALLGSDGTRKAVVAGENASTFAMPIMVCRSAADSSNTVQGTETILNTCTIPANILGADGTLAADVFASGLNTNTGNCRVRIHWCSGSGVAACGTIASDSGANGTRGQAYEAHARISNRGATNSQIESGTGLVADFGANLTQGVTAALDTTATTYVITTVVNSGAADTCTLNQVEVTAWP